MEEAFIYKNKYLKEVKTNVLEDFVQNDKHYLVLEKNIFYPQGGGQKGDRGSIFVDGTEFNVVNTVKDFNGRSVALLEIENKNEESWVGKEVQVFLNWAFRYQQMRLHSALHLLHYFIVQVLGEIEYPTLSMINTDGTAINQYQEERITKELMDEVYSKITSEIDKGGKMVTYPDLEKEGYRYWKYKDYIIPCGGIHADDVKEIGKISFDYSSKKGHQTIKIKLED